MERTTRAENKSPLNKTKTKKAQKRTDGDYDGNYEYLIQVEMHRLSDLSLKVPKCLQAEIYQMSIQLQSILQECQRNRDIAKL